MAQAAEAVGELALGLPELLRADAKARFDLRVAAADEADQLLRRALIVAHYVGALLRHRGRHLLLAGFARRGFIANTDVAIAHD
ncbi:hypothetical protein H8A97_40495 [Bradyrhizobium sp. Arg62]|uniref:hypothetical protein n=1 Tax=Bradyrhizobium brasilense TaxID=1419277 RepID=UPI001E5AAB13|nr:hypothetical protein [Bradyrhizobium brasilense]MCC8951164.1 hypothetical protein [Bradyrhizobium brasilense]